MKRKPRSLTCNACHSCNDALDDKGFVKTDEFQRILGYEAYNMFAAGDICSADRFEAGERTAVVAVRQGGCASQNIARLAYQRATMHSIPGYRGSWVARSEQGSKWCR